MEYTNLGSTGLKVSRLGFGGIPIQRITQEEATALIHKLPALKTSAPTISTCIRYITHPLPRWI